MPRLQVSLILFVTGLAGFLASLTLLRLGLLAMWLRYPVAILFAYGVFLLLLRLWLEWQRGGRPDPDDFGLSDADISLPRAGRREAGFSFSGGGGDAGGGGAGWSWGEGLQTSSSTGRGGSSAVDALDLDLDGGCLFVLALAAIIGALLASLYVIYIAPALLAEILVDGLLVTGLYRRMKRVEQRHWLWAAVRRTWLPVLLTALFFGAAGYALQRAAPGARSVGEAWQRVWND